MSKIQMKNQTNMNETNIMLCGIDSDLQDLFKNYLFLPVSCLLYTLFLHNIFLHNIVHRAAGENVFCLLPCYPLPEAKSFFSNVELLSPAGGDFLLIMPCYPSPIFQTINYFICNIVHCQDSISL